MENATAKQEMPPKGGYAGIQFDRIPMKKPWSGVKIFSIWAGVTVCSYYVYYLAKKMVRRNKRENDDVTVSLEPLLRAERDRMYLNQLRKNRDEEAELMKDVPGWIVGTYYGDPIYKTTGDRLMEPHIREYYAHTTDFQRRYMWTYQAWF